MILGICLESGRFRAAWMEGSLAQPRLVDRDRCINPDADDLRRSAKWFSGRLEHMLRKRPLQRVVSKIHYSISNQSGVLSHGAPLGILGVMCHDANLPLDLVTKTKLKGYKAFNLAKGVNPYTWVDALRDTQPYWDEAAKDAILAATSALPR